mgnify:CR=1 FL=1|jgi:hypothetical protein
MEDDYKTRMVEEYHELKERISRLDDVVTRYKRGELEFKPKCLGGMTIAQLYIMQDYLYILFDRIKAMGISLDSDDEPNEKPLPPEPQSHGLFIPRDGKPYLILHDENDTWSYVVNTPGVMCKINAWRELSYDGDWFSGYLNWEQLVEDLQDSAFPLIPLNASNMPAIAKALADND